VKRPFVSTIGMAVLLIAAASYALRMKHPTFRQGRRVARHPGPQVRPFRISHTDLAGVDAIQLRTLGNHADIATVLFTDPAGHPIRHPSAQVYPLTPGKPVRIPVLISPDHSVPEPTLDVVMISSAKLEAQVCRGTVCGPAQAVPAQTAPALGPPAPATHAGAPAPVTPVRAVAGVPRR
jgi:hypothetical protein